MDTIAGRVLLRVWFNLALALDLPPDVFLLMMVDATRSSSSVVPLWITFDYLTLSVVPLWITRSVPVSLFISSRQAPVASAFRVSSLDL